MKIIGKIEVETVTDVVCDVCRCSTLLGTGGHQFGVLEGILGLWRFP